MINWYDALLWVGITLVAYWLSVRFFRLTGNKVIFHPLIVTVCIMLVVLFITVMPVAEYQSATSILHWLLGPATIALAIPLYRQLPHIRRLGFKILIPIMLGGTIAPLLALLVFYLGEAPAGLTLSILPKSITTPLAMDVASIIGGYPALAAIFVVLTGVFGAVFCTWVFALKPELSEESKGIALGTIAHAIGTSQALTMSERTGAFASLALCINGIITAVALPVLYFLLN